MMSTYYTNDRTTQIVLYLLKAHGIRKVIVSPGTTNVTLVASMQTCTPILSCILRWMKDRLLIWPVD